MYVHSCWTGVRDINGLNNKGYTAVHVVLKSYSASSSSVEIIKVLANREGVEINKEDINGETPLHLAVKSSCITAIQVLIRCGGDLGARRKVDGCAPLHVALHTANERVVRLLVRSGASLTVADNKGDILWDLACSIGRRRILRVLNGTGVKAKGMIRVSVLLIL